MIRHLIALTIAMGCFATTAFAEDYKLGDLEIHAPWARASATKAANGAAYLTIKNTAKTADKLIRVETPAASEAAMHINKMDNNVMRMRPLEAVEVEPGKPTVMRPGGMHIMLMGLKAPLREGTKIPLTLTFEKAGKIKVDVEVGKVGDLGPGKDAETGDESMSHEKMDHGDHSKKP